MDENLKKFIDQSIKSLEFIKIMEQKNIVMILIVLN